MLSLISINPSSVSLLETTNQDQKFDYHEHLSPSSPSHPLATLFNDFGFVNAATFFTAISHHRNPRINLINQPLSELWVTLDFMGFPKY
ncbi:unnamed protein product [Lactuca virosa]|uniref:Uncharacterized protein n=1 Tax=Lactuca virosa TaxID=75947 RepID=A0AAU9PKI8_9ASTR|nr:unnamed protein product [Lactuca virosa]